MFCHPACSWLCTESSNMDWSQHWRTSQGMLQWCPLVETVAGTQRRQTSQAPGLHRTGCPLYWQCRVCCEPSIISSWISWIPYVFKKIEQRMVPKHCWDLRHMNNSDSGLYKNLIQASLPVLATKYPGQHFPPNSKTFSSDTTYK